MVGDRRAIEASQLLQWLGEELPACRATAILLRRTRPPEDAGGEANRGMRLGATVGNPGSPDLCGAGLG